MDRGIRTDCKANIDPEIGCASALHKHSNRWDEKGEEVKTHLALTLVNKNT